MTDEERLERQFAFIRPAWVEAVEWPEAGCRKLTHLIVT